jgi:hypothetical protein
VLRLPAYGGLEGQVHVAMTHSDGRRSLKIQVGGPPLRRRENIASLDHAHPLPLQWSSSAGYGSF